MDRFICKRRSATFWDSMVLHFRFENIGNLMSETEMQEASQTQLPKVTDPYYSARQY